MALPNTINPNAPDGLSARKLGDDQIRALKQFLIDVFGLPNNLPISNAVFSVNQSGEISGIRLLGTVIDPKFLDFTDLANTIKDLWLKGDTPNARFVGTEAGAKDWRVAEKQGNIVIEQNTGTEVLPIWSNRIVLTSTGTVKIYSGTVYSVELNHTATGNRILKLPNQVATNDELVSLAAIQTLINKTLTAPVINNVDTLTMGVNKPIKPANAPSGNPVANAIYNESICKAWATFSMIGATTLDEGYNIASIADNGVGLTTLTFKTAMATSTYACVFGIEKVGAGSIIDAVVQARAVGSVQVRCAGSSTGTLTDADHVSLAIFGTQ